MSIRLENVSFRYLEDTPMETEALLDVTLEIADGEFVGIIGPTGSGKSTLIQHFNGLLLPSSGKVWVDGVDLTHKDTQLRQIRQKVGMVFQYPEHQLFGETVLEDVGFGPRNMGLAEEEVVERVRRALAYVGLDFAELKDQSPFELSGGQKRRVAIAGVLAMEPSVLILDEPTAGLDPKGREEILDEICTLHRERGITVILVTHSMEDVARLVDRLIVMDRGRVALDGTPVEVFRQAETLKELGLGLPQVTELMHELKAKGMAVDTDVLTVEAAEEEIVKALGGQR
ncbi:MAG: energy-coupling factor transporter ATPase [Limnochordia bacterium]|jgi:energy-coupling factor transport system ATP-binding protein|nr:energy-coupling factor transporter ATPase [Bacillota bacterium]HOB40623.1 energy-coupling factor transporter ATPase [Limnochordia bacterium]HAI52022.1 energy-coupling factor transporter ATPase [Bacillota bacterium]HAN95891.1 energy-coupling factor transporter ATPase [Bacillota bacterium]HOK30819.1 energy-coupling factor transporter ATPase [Limnochordia bacterium]